MRVMGRVAAAIRLLGLLIAFVIAIGIALKVLDAKGTGLVATYYDICLFLVDPFRGLIDLEKGREELQLAINWGIAALVYLLIALLIAALLNRLAGGGGFGRRRRAAKT